MWAVRSFSSSRKSVHKRCAMDEEKLKKKEKELLFFKKINRRLGSRPKKRRYQRISGDGFERVEPDRWPEEIETTR